MKGKFVYAIIILLDIIIFTIVFAAIEARADSFQIFDNQDSDEVSLSFVAAGSNNSTDILNTQIAIYGVFDGASVDIEFQAEDDNWYSTNDTSFTTSGLYFAQINSNVPYRLSLTDSGTSTNISATVYNALTYPDEKISFSSKKLRHLKR